ncbi:hypothetical protein OTU49_008344 [Cherax quadricarinatus]|uniref:Uncharacterized protein n=1 Tax=Cherax quadricarinatus TaxID=27406 RepID=A0AAW0WPU3_CHEQU|nr:uncharacterized protein LOC128704129 [Cherax quadricarinatus]XP_053655157.1 uncharacterized protein LOC128704129 [Cherax quadricarinatus]
MSSTVVPAPDRENTSAHLGNKMKQFQGTGSHSKYGALPTVTSHAQKKFGLPIGGSQTGQRSFGDISNRIGTVATKNQSAANKKIQNQSANENWQSFSSSTEKNLQPEPEFFPEITETEDYFDIFPSSLHFSDEHLSQLVKFWELCRLPELSTLPSAIQSSPPRHLSLSSVQDKEPVYLEPVLEEIYDLPPPPWE